MVHVFQLISLSKEYINLIWSDIYFHISEIDLIIYTSSYCAFNFYPVVFYNFLGNYIYLKAVKHKRFVFDLF